MLKPLICARKVRTLDRQSIITACYSSFRADRFPDLYDLAHIAGWEPDNLHDLEQVSNVGSVLFRSCTTAHNGRLGSTMVDYLDHHPSDV